MKSMLRPLAVILVTLLLSPPGLAQQPAPPASGAAAPPAQQQRPRVGVALAGGSALGLAHVGVLRWLEEHRVPVDYIAGTSMGGLVGGLYASGQSGTEISEFVAKVDWDEAFQAAPPYSDLSFRRKEDRRAFPNSFEIGLRHGANLPAGLSPGHGVGLLLSRIAAPYTNLRSFDDLPTPFRCVATDLIEGKQVIFGKGDLGNALRATMSIPVLFSPVEEDQDKRVFVDGGTLNNLPVDIVRQMGADIVIAVSLIPPPPKEAPQSLLGVAERTINVMVTENELASLRLADIILLPDLAGHTAADFSAANAADLEQRGYASAASKSALLQRFALDEAAWNEFLAARNGRRRTIGDVQAESARVQGAQSGETRRLEAFMSPVLHRPLDTREVESRLTRITGLGRYRSAAYRTLQTPGGTELLVQLSEKRHGPPILNTLLLIDGAEPTNVRFGVGARLTFYDFGGPFSEWRSEFQIGSTNRLLSEYYWRVGGSAFFVAPRAFIEQTRLPAYVGNTRVADFTLRQAGGGVDIGIAGARHVEFRIGAEAVHADVEQKIGLPLAVNTAGPVSSLRTQLAWDSTDSHLVPRRGGRVLVSGRWVFQDPVATQVYPLVDVQLLRSQPLGKRNFLLSRISGGTTGGRDAAINSFRLGGPFRLSALSIDQLIGNNYYYGGFFVLRNLSDQPLSFLGHTYFGLGYEIGDVFNDVKSRKPFHMGTIGLISETPVGALFIGGSVGDKGQRKFFFRIGPTF